MTLWVISGNFHSTVKRTYKSSQRKDDQWKEASHNMLQNLWSHSDQTFFFLMHDLEEDPEARLEKIRLW